MKNLVKLVLIVSVFGYGSLTFGQTATQSPATVNQNAPKTMTADERAEKRTEQLKGKLNLTPEQMPKVKQIILKNEAEVEKSLKAAGQDITARKAAADKNREILVNEMSKVLNPEQAAKFKAMEENHTAAKGGQKTPTPPAQK